MTKKERLMVLEKIAYMSDKELEEKAIRLTYESLGTQTERMYELGYDTEDIIEQEKHEKYLNEVSDIYLYVAEKRGIKLFEKEVTNNDSR